MDGIPVQLKHSSGINMVFQSVFPQELYDGWVMSLPHLAGSHLWLDHWSKQFSVEHLLHFAEKKQKKTWDV